MAPLSLGEEVITNALQESPRLLLSCYVVPSTDIGLVQVPHEDQGLWRWGYCYLSADGLIHLVFLVRWLRAAIAIKSLLPVLSLILTHKISFGSSSTSRQSSMHSSCCCTWRSTSPAHLPILSFLKDLYPSIAILQSWEPSHHGWPGTEYSCNLSGNNHFHINLSSMSRITQRWNKTEQNKIKTKKTLHLLLVLAKASHLYCAQLGTQKTYSSVKDRYHNIPT